MKNFIKKMFSVLYWIGFIFVSTFFCLSVLITRIFTFPFDRYAKIANTVSCGWGVTSIFINPNWRLKIKGRKNIKWKGTYVIVANHQSYFDVMVLYTLLRPYKYLAKDSLKKVPVIGLGMALNQYIFVKREDRKSRAYALRKCKEWLENGVSIAIFPEGTRSPNGQLQPFHTGAFRMAIEAGVPIVPVVIKGTRGILPKHSFLLGGKTEIQVLVQDPVPTKDYNISQAKELKQKVHDQMNQELLRNSSLV